MMIKLIIFLFLIVPNNSGDCHSDYDNETKRESIKLNMKQGLIMNQILSIYSLTNPLNKRCKEHSIEFSEGLRAFEPWALQMFDSSSKIQSGILVGNLNDYGSFKQCLEIYKNSEFDGIIRGKHCTIKVLPDINITRHVLSFRNISDKRFDKIGAFVKQIHLGWSVCIPDSCGPDDILPHFKKMIYSLSEGLNLTVTLSEDDCYTIFDQKPFNQTEIFILICFGLYFFIILLATIINIYENLKSTGDHHDNKFVEIFSAYKNFQQILAKGKQSDLDCVHGVRLLSTCYVVIGHRYFMLMFYPSINSLDILNWITKIWSTSITGGTLCVDTFFMISGMLVCLGYLKEMEKHGKINWFMFYLYRYLRLTPPLGIVVLIYAMFIQHLGSGPFWNETIEILQVPCKEYWWATLLHIQNYVHSYPLCIVQTWSLTCDMIYYFLSPLILIPLTKFGIFGFIYFGVIYIISVATNFYLAWARYYDGAVPITNEFFKLDFFQHHYITPHTRAAPYLIGLAMGYFIFKTKDEKLKINKFFIISGWLIATIIMLASLTGCYTFYQEQHDYNRLEAAFYISFSRSAWTFGIVWIVWSCINGYGGIINSILSSHLFRVLGRIGYSIYLLHLLLQYTMNGAAKMPGYFSDFNSLYQAFGDLCIMIIIGFFFTICFESPIVKLFSLFVRKDKKTQKIGVEAN